MLANEPEVITGETRIGETMYQCAACSREFASRSGRSRHNIIVHRGRSNGDMELLDIPSELASETATKVRVQLGPRRKRLAVSPRRNLRQRRLRRGSPAARCQSHGGYRAGLRRQRLRREVSRRRVSTHRRGTGNVPNRLISTIPDSVVL